MRYLYILIHFIFSLKILIAFLHTLLMGLKCNHFPILTFEFLPPLRDDCSEYVLWTTCSGVEDDLSEEWSEPFSTMLSPSWLCGVGECERLRRTGEQAGVLLFELLAVLKNKNRDCVASKTLLVI